MSNSSILQCLQQPLRKLYKQIPPKLNQNILLKIYSNNPHEGKNKQKKWQPKETKIREQRTTKKNLKITLVLKNVGSLKVK